MSGAGRLPGSGRNETGRERQSCRKHPSCDVIRKRDQYDAGVGPATEDDAGLAGVAGAVRVCAERADRQIVDAVVVEVADTGFVINGISPEGYAGMGAIVGEIEMCLLAEAPAAEHYIGRAGVLEAVRIGASRTDYQVPDPVTVMSPALLTA